MVEGEVEPHRTSPTAGGRRLPRPTIVSVDGGDIRFSCGVVVVKRCCHLLLFDDGERCGDGQLGDDSVADDDDNEAFRPSRVTSPVRARPLCFISASRRLSCLSFCNCHGGDIVEFFMADDDGDRC